MNSTTNFATVAAFWKADKKQYVKTSTYATYCLLVRCHLVPELGGRTDVTEEDAQALVNRKLAAGLSRKTVRDIVTVLRMILRFAARRNLMPARRIEVTFPTERERREPEVLTLANQRRLMTYVREHFSFRNLGICICLSAGLRIGEVCALQWEDIDTAAGVIRVRKTIQRIWLADGGERINALVLDSPKTRNSIREVPMTRELLALVRPLKKMVRSDFFVLTNDAAPMEPRTYRAWFDRLQRQLGLPRMRFHGLRHSFATRCIESRCDCKTVSVLLGHSSVSTTLNLYVHPNLDQKRKCIDAMGRLCR